MQPEPLPRSFYTQGALAAARGLLGALLVRQIPGETLVGRIVETEAYIGPEDKACHAYQNRRTARTEVMFSAGGHAYIYLIYGMYHCLNVVAGPAGKPEAVLIRSLEPLVGLNQMRTNRRRGRSQNEHPPLTNGPGKLCQALAITKALNGHDLTVTDTLWIGSDPAAEDLPIAAGPRINIAYGEEYRTKPWRFYFADHPWLSC